jgi:hypothetical protein
MSEADERADVPVLTEVVHDEAPDEARSVPAMDGATLEALARQLERAVLERLSAEIDRMIGQALDEVRAELAVSVPQTVREAVAASVAQALAIPRGPHGRT